MAEVEFKGEQFTISERVGLMPLMRFAKVAKSGVDANELDGLVAMYDLLEQCFPEQEWQRFQDHAAKTRADGDELMGLVGRVFEVLSERPTQRPSVSSDGSSPTNVNSADGSSSQAVLLREQQGRPDLALVHRVAEQRASA